MQTSTNKVNSYSKVRDQIIMTQESVNILICGRENLQHSFGGIWGCQQQMATYPDHERI